MNMEIRRKNIITVLLAVSLWLPLDSGVARAQEQGTRNVQGALGTVEFRVSCTVEAQESFTRGVALLHSFTYEESAEAFRKAAATDPRCAMAHWGLAMTEYHQLWEPYAGPAELKRGTAEIQKARESKAETPREIDYIEALGVFYDGWEQRNHAARAKAYQEAMHGVQKRNPKDQEASILYALALVATASLEDKTYANQRKAAAILETVFAARTFLRGWDSGKIRYRRILRPQPRRASMATLAKSSTRWITWSMRICNSGRMMRRRRSAIIYPQPEMRKGPLPSKSTLRKPRFAPAARWNNRNGRRPKSWPPNLECSRK